MARHRNERGRACAAALAAALALGCAGGGLAARDGALAAARDGAEGSAPGGAPATAPEARPRPPRAAPAAGPSAARDEDPFAGTASLDRARVVEAVLRRNPTLEAARQAWRAALARFPQETGLPDPMLAYRVAPRSLASRTVDDAHVVELAQPIPFPGTRRLRGEVALADADAAREAFEAARLRLATAASLLFDDLYVAARALEVNEHHHGLLEELQAVARSRYEAGEVSAGAALQAEVELGQLARERATLEAEARVAGHALNALLHRAPDAPLPPPPARLGPAPLAPGAGPRAGARDDAARAAAPGEAPPPAPGAPGHGELAAALADRPELRAADARVRAGEAEVALARRAFLPDVTLVGGYDGMEEASEMRPMVGLSFEVPLQLGRRRAALEEARARLESARAERAALEAELHAALASAAARVEEARRVLAVVRDRLLPAARDRLDAARAAFETGQEDFDALITAQRDLSEVELAEHRALADVERRAAELASARGVLPGLAR